MLGDLADDRTLAELPEPQRVALEAALLRVPAATSTEPLGVSIATRHVIRHVAGDRPLILAIDGQPCDPFEPVRRTIPVGPGARFDLMFDLPESSLTSTRRSLPTAPGSMCS